MLEGRPRLRRFLLRALRSIAIFYVILCVVARFGYRKLLYPAPTADVGTSAGARVLDLVAADGAAVHAKPQAPASG